MTIAEAIKQGHELDVYLDSEMSDRESGSLDDLWQSIFDVLQLAAGGIIESDPRELTAGLVWLEKTQSLTKDYVEKKIPFAKEIRNESM